jgi:hypothetical protein
MSDADADFAAKLAWPEFQFLYRYWRSKQAEGTLPARSAIHPAEFPKLLPRIYLVDVVRADAPPLQFRYRLCGSEHFLINGKEITGLELAEAMAPQYVDAIRAVYSYVAESGQPHVARSFAAIEGRQHVVYDRLLLPLANDGRTVNMMLGYLHPVTMSGQEAPDVGP